MVHREWVHRISKIYVRDTSVTDPQQQRINATINRLHALRLLEQDFNLPAGSLVMHIVPDGLGKKWADVRVLYNGELLRLSKMDDTTYGTLSAGGLKAQLDRFDGLWGAALFGAPEAIENVKKQQLDSLLVRTFKGQVLGMRIGESPHDLATRMASNGSLDYAQIHLLQTGDAIARREVPRVVYPSGRRTIRSLFEPGTG